MQFYNESYIYKHNIILPVIKRNSPFHLVYDVKFACTIKSGIPSRAPSDPVHLRKFINFRKSSGETRGVSAG